MYGGNKKNSAVLPFFDSKNIQCPAEASNQPQLYGNLLIDFHVESVNFLQNKHGSPGLPHNECGWDTEAILRCQNLQIYLNNDTCHDEANRLRSISNQNPVSTGLRLSYDDDEHNSSSITSASGSMMASSSIISSLINDIKTEFDQQNEELKNYIRIQEEHIAKGVSDMKQRHTTSLLIALENRVGKKLQEKNLEFESITRKNRELVESMKKVTAEAQSWCYMAKNNESMCDILKTNLQQAMQDSNQGKEGFGDSDMDDAASFVDPNKYLGLPGGSGKPKSDKNNFLCKLCKMKDARILLMPCRHLCLCKDCEGSVHLCPVCRLITTAHIEVYLL
ncbi:E3 ubiquitin-protein ligase BOI-like isoform X1 [Olea europaea var. sylvestris]|uniref:E3 ubiquitin-protein ligase BOI-like isoform X1 n=1 Tax=Olea europaea var. sylvestris TaxID=158386 RepID=UPI000C1D70BD|nr:E3 ubiquitin-protein ligase BOI-like isoform X1 [Olea europaea var. sylvestris]XP_022881793.1 E3 ubiquitin-protein ligase BOI-like isoform X1 [Olea europaea var. sylvestris]